MIYKHNQLTVHNEQAMEDTWGDISNWRALTQKNSLYLRKESYDKLPYINGADDRNADIIGLNGQGVFTVGVSLDRHYPSLKLLLHETENGPTETRNFIKALENDENLNLVGGKLPEDRDCQGSEWCSCFVPCALFNIDVIHRERDMISLYEIKTENPYDVAECMFRDVVWYARNAGIFRKITIRRQFITEQHFFLPEPCKYISVALSKWVILAKFPLRMLLTCG